MDTRLRDQKDAEEVLEKLRNLINRVWEQRDKIKPSYKTRAKITVLEIYKYLPKTNCGACGVPTCLAFALKLIGKSLPFKIDLEHTEKRERLLVLLAEAGYIDEN